MSIEQAKVPIHLKLTLTIKEAAEYSNIGINKIDDMLLSISYFSLLNEKSLRNLSVANC